MGICSSERNKRKADLESSKNSNTTPVSQKQNKTPNNPNKKTTIFEKYPKLNDIMKNKDSDIQNSFIEIEDEDDQIFKKLIDYEKTELTTEFLKLREKYINMLKEKKILYKDNNLVNNIFEKENSKMVFKEKILKKIDTIKNDNEKFNIKYLTILLFGRKGVGKTELVNYILKKDIDDEIKTKMVNNDLFEYESSNDDIKLKLIEYKGYGIDKNINPTIIGNNTKEYIRDLINKKNQQSNFNDFVHCIWFCVQRTRLQESEIIVLQELKKVYGSNIMPIIIVYTNAGDSSVAREMKDYIFSDNSGIKGLIKKTDFIKVNSKKYKMAGTDVDIPPFGDEDLLKTTLTNCTQSLEGKMKTIMMKNISDDIIKDMKKDNSNNEKKIIDSIVEEFIENYKKVKKDENFINYLVNMLGINLKDFYEKDISKATLNLIFNSNIIKNIKDYISFYKDVTKNQIKKIIEEKAKIFLNKQVQLEKDENENIKIKNKRRLNKFKKTTEIFLKYNFYYISQKYIILDMIENYCLTFFKNFKNNIDIQIKNLFNRDDNKKYIDKDINDNLKYCFLLKLKNFADLKGIQLDEHHLKNINRSHIVLPNIDEINNTKLYENNINQDSFELNLDDDDNKETKSKIRDEIKILKDWFPLKVKKEKWVYINEQNIKKLNDYCQKMIYQDDYFKNESNDEVFNSLKKSEKKNLINFFEEKKVDFISIIHKEFNNKFGYNISPKQAINIIINNENISTILKNRIKIEFDKLYNDKNFTKINYITTIVIGKSGVGKSTLVSRLLNRKIITRTGGIQTIETQLYINKEISFLRIYDTRGIELNEIHGPKQIFEEASKLINKDNKGTKNIDNIQCIWYCITDNIIEETEKRFIEKMSKNQNKQPIIVVYTYAKNEEFVNEMENEINNNFKNVPFIQVLSKGVENEQTGAKSKPYGLDKLLEKTFEMCKQAVNSTIYQKVKDDTTNKLINIFNKKNKDINEKLNNQIVYSITEEFNQVLTEDIFLKHCFHLFEQYLSGFLRNNDELTIILGQKSKDDLKKSSNNLRNLYLNYTKFYQKKVSNIVNKTILENKAIEFLDIQVKKEKKKDKNIYTENKNNKEDFTKIINHFLKDNFDYIAQRYFLYHLITDIFESFSKDIEDEVNKNIKKIISSDPEVKTWFNNIHQKKIEDLIEIYKQFLPKSGYFDDKDKGENTRKIINNDESYKKEDDINDNLPPAINIY